MPQKRVLELLGTFDKKLWSRCRTFIDQRYRCTTKERSLFDLVYKKRNNLDHHSLTPDQIYHRHFNTCSKSNYHKISSRLYKTLEDFVIQDELVHGQYHFERQMILSNYYMRSGLFYQFVETSRALIKWLEEGQEYDLHKRIRLMLVRFELAFSQLKLSNKKDYFRHAIQDLIIYTQNLKKLFGIEVQSQSVLFNNDLDTQVDYQSNELYILLKHMENIAIHGDEESYTNVADRVFELYTSHHSKLILIAYVYMINYCYQRIKAGDSDARLRLIDLYNKGLSSGLLLSCGPLTEARFLNIVEAKSNFERGEHHEPFIQQWLQKTETDHRESVYNLSMAYMYFGIADYEKTQCYLNKEIKFASLHLSIMYRWMRICLDYKTHDEARNKIPFINILKQHKKYIKRKANEISEANYLGSLNLIRVVKMMHKKKHPSDIKDKVNGMNHLVKRNWIEQELDKMLGSESPTSIK